MLRRFYSLIIATFFLINLLMTTSLTQTATASEPPIWGDWIIEDNTTVCNETEPVVVHGDVIVKNGSALTLNRCTLQIDSLYPGQHGIDIEKGGALYAYDCTFTTFYSYQLYTFKVSGKLVIEKCDINNMYNFGLHLYETEDAVIKYCQIHDCGPYCNGISIQDSTALIESTSIYRTYIGIHCKGTTLTNQLTNATILNSSIWSTDTGVVGFGNTIAHLSNNSIWDNQVGVLWSDSSQTRMMNNIIKSNSINGVDYDNNATGYVFGNTISSNAYGGIVCFKNTAVNICSNTISYNEKRGIELNDNSIVDISANAICLNSEVGIGCAEKSTVTIIGNTIATNGDRGVVVENNAQAIILNNALDSNSGSSIECFHSSATNISGNNILRNGRWGVHSQLSPNGKLTVENNYLYGNGEAGIAVNFPSDVTICNNTVSSSPKNGIEVLNGATPLIANSTILDSGKYDIYTSNNSHPTIVNTKLDLNKLFFNDTESIVSIGYWVEVNARNNNSVPVQNAKVIIANNDSIEIFNGSTNYEGRICSMPVIALEMSYPSKINYYTPHSIYVAKLGLSESEQVIVEKNIVVDFILAVSDKLARGNLITENVDGHDITVEYSGNGSIIITPVTNPPLVPKDKKNIGIFFNITATDTVEEIYITVHYDPEDYVPSAEGSVLKMYYWDSNVQQWIPVSESGVDIHNQLVWARVSHLTIFAPMAEEISKPVSKGNVWLLYGIASITSFAILFVVYIILKRKNILLQSKTGK